jgi:hypothetical protein
VFEIGRRQSDRPRDARVRRIAVRPQHERAPLDRRQRQDRASKVPIPFVRLGQRRRRRRIGEEFEMIAAPEIVE